MATQLRKVDARGRVMLTARFAGQVVTVSVVSDTEVLIRLVKTPRPRPALNALLSQINGATAPEKIEFGAAAGNELL